MSLLEARELYRFFHDGNEEVMALRGVSLTLDEGDFVALTGLSGSGKSTLLACLAGLDDPDGGLVICQGRQVSRVSETERMDIRSRHMGIMLQGNNLVGHLTVAGNVSLPVERLREDKSARHAEALARLDTWGLGARQSFYPHQLSGGERARASLAVAMACSPALLFLDEPTGEVDAATEALIIASLMQHCGGGGAVVMSTHSRRLSAEASRVMALANGRLAND